MAEFVAEPAQSTQVFYGDATTTTTEVTNVLTVVAPNQMVRVMLANTLASMRDTFVVSSVQGNGELSFTCQHQAAQTGALKVVQDAKAVKYWKIGLPDTNGDILFQGVLLDVELDVSGGPESIPEVTCKVQVTGDETFTVGT